MSNDTRHPAGTSLGGQWAPGSASEVDTDDFGGGQTDAADFMADSPDVKAFVTFEAYDDRGNNSIDIREDEVDAEAWLHTKSVEELEDIQEEVDIGGVPDDLVYDMENAGKMNTPHGASFRISVDEDQLGGYIDKRKSAGLEESLVKQVEPTWERQMLYKSESLVHTAPDMDNFDQMTADQSMSPAERAIGARAAVRHAHSRYLADLDDRGVEIDPATDRELRDLYEAPHTNNSYEDIISTSTRYRALISRSETIAKNIRSRDGN